MITLTYERFFVLVLVTLHFLGGIGLADCTGAQGFLGVGDAVIPFDRVGPSMVLASCSYSLVVLSSASLLLSLSEVLDGVKC